MNAALPDPLHEEREPSPEEWAECAAALRALGIDAENGGRVARPMEAPEPGELVAPVETTETSEGPGAHAETAAFLHQIVALDRRRARAIGRASRRRRFELREALIDAGFRVEQGSRWTRGLRLAWAYGALRLRESRALRVAAALLFVNLLAMPLAAWVARQQAEPEHLSHGLHHGTTLMAPELLAEEPYALPEAEDPREELEPRAGR
ncbi:MAG: hypothetical protein IPN34_03775 [Planctomycetes bacterium]|nr:hypothetical protein [Planctomycetota bacterium]